jgi:hypothetical protein
MKPLLSLPGIHFLARRFGWTSLKSRAFAARFKTSWTQDEESPVLARMVEQKAGAGNILILGCGVNSLGKILNPHSYLSVMGVDLCEPAIDRARQNAPVNQSFYVSDMLSWSSWSSIDVTVFPESVYYCPKNRMLSMLSNAALKSGSVVVTIADPGRYGYILDLIRRHFRVETDRVLEAGKARHVIVFGTKV